MHMGKGALPHCSGRMLSSERVCTRDVTQSHVSEIRKHSTLSEQIVSNKLIMRLWAHLN